MVAPSVAVKVQQPGSGKLKPVPHFKPGTIPTGTGVIVRPPDRLNDCPVGMASFDLEGLARTRNPPDDFLILSNLRLIEKQQRPHFTR